MTKATEIATAGLGFLLSVVVIQAQQPPAQYRCLASRLIGQDTFIEATIFLKFKDAKFNEEWYLRTLRPTLDGKLFNDPGAPIEPVTARYSADEVSLTFCFESVPQDEPLTLKFGRFRKLSLQSRPVRFLETNLPTGEKVHYGTMTQIRTLSQDPPEWGTVTRADWEKTTSGESRLTLQLFNPTDHELGVGDLFLNFLTRGGAGCGGIVAGPVTPGTFIPVEVTKEPGGFTVSTSDPAFPGELIRRAVESKCGGEFRIPLGFISSVSQGFTELRFRFGGSGFPDLLRLLAAAQLIEAGTTRFGSIATTGSLK